MANVHVPLVQAKNLFYYLIHVLTNELHIKIPIVNQYFITYYYIILYKELSICTHMISVL